MRDLGAGNVDFVIAYGSAEIPVQHSPSHLEALVIGHDRLIPVCKPDNDGAPRFSFDNDAVEMPFLRFGDPAPISLHLQRLFATKQITPRLRTVYENSMAGALRIRARDGAGVAWLPASLVAPDLSAGILVQTGPADWTVDLEIRMMRHPKKTNHLTRSIWNFLQTREAAHPFHQT
jgi:DNA-binding transcriptional LysR family regulator